MAQLIPSVEALRDAISETDLADESQELASLSRPAVCFEKAEAPTPSFMWGETSVLPSDIAWPEHDGRPLETVGVIDLASCPVGQLDVSLPSTGALLFFTQIGNECSWSGETGEWHRVIHVAEPGPNRRQPPGASLEAAAPRELLNVQPHLGITATAHLEAAWGSERNSEWNEAKHGASRSTPYCYVQLCGFPDPVQSDPTWGSDLILLAEFDDLIVGSWYFMIDPADLEAGRFDRTVCEWQC